MKKVEKNQPKFFKFSDENLDKALVQLEEWFEQTKPNIKVNL